MNVQNTITKPIIETKEVDIIITSDAILINNQYEPSGKIDEIWLQRMDNGYGHIYYESGHEAVSGKVYWQLYMRGERGSNTIFIYWWK